jgi:hypothetical protein
MLIRTFGSCWLLAALSAAAFAQTQSEKPKAMTNEELTAAVKTLQTELAAVAANLSETVTQVSDLKKQQKTLTDRINEEITKQQQILEAISKIDSAGQPIPRISAIMDKSGEFRDDVRQAVRKSMETEGDLSVANKTGSFQRILINRKEYGLSAGQTLSLKVPVGTVSTQLPGQNLTNWTVGAPDYKESIDIVPASTPSTVVAPPIYLTPPTVFYSLPVAQYYVWQY